MNGGVTDGAVISGAADNEEHNAAAEEEQQDKQKIAANDMDFDGGDSNNAVENRVEEEEAAAAEKEAKNGEKSVADAAGVKAEGEAVLPPADGSLIFEGPQVMNTERKLLSSGGDFSRDLYSFLRMSGNVRWLMHSSMPGGATNLTLGERYVKNEQPIL
jgi:hypothetical protein